MPPFCDRHEQYYQRDPETGKWRCPDCPIPCKQTKPQPTHPEGPQHDR